MINKLKAILKKKFVKNVMLVATGTMAAQAITLLFAPIITRLYGPEVYGIMGVFNTMVLIVVPLAALALPIAMVLPKEDRQALSLAKLSILTAGFVSGFLLLVLLLFQDAILQLFNIEELSSFIFLLPLVVIVSAFMQMGEQWLIRKKEFKSTAKAAFWHSLILNGSKAVGGLWMPVASVLVTIASFGNGIKALFLYRYTRMTDPTIPPKLVDFSGERRRMKDVLKRHRDFPIFRAPQMFIDAVTQGLPIMMLTVFFGPAASGFYAISHSVMNLSTTLIGKAVGDVFYQRVAEAAIAKENITRLIIRAIMGLAAIGVIPFSLVILFGPTLFGFVFGAEWDVAGHYARWIAIGFFFKFAYQPVIKSLPVLNAQSIHLYFTVFSLLIRSSAIFLGYYLFQDDIIAVAFFGVSGAFLYIGFTLITLYISRKYDANQVQDQRV